MSEEAVRSRSSETDKHFTFSGKYDDEYISYVFSVLEKAGQRGLKVLIDVHQDCVSYILLEVRWLKNSNPGVST